MINFLAMAMMARMAPFIAFSLLYFNLIKGSFALYPDVNNDCHKFLPGKGKWYRNEKRV